MTAGDPEVAAAHAIVVQGGFTTAAREACGMLHDAIRGARAAAEVDDQPDDQETAAADVTLHWIEQHAATDLLLPDIAAGETRHPLLRRCRDELTPAPALAVCETLAAVTAHIRILGTDPFRPNGGVPNRALCRRDTRNGWDLDAHGHVTPAVLDQLTPDWICRRCEHTARRLLNPDWAAGAPVVAYLADVRAYLAAAEARALHLLEPTR